MRVSRLLMVCLASSALFGCSKPQVEATPRLQAVRVIQPKPGPAAPPIITSGIVTSADEMKLSFKTGGVIARVLVQEGAAVKAGQTLVELMPTEINAAVTQAQQLNDKAQRDLARGERLYADQVITLEQWQNLQTQAKVAMAQLDSARFNQQWTRVAAPTDGVVLRKLVDDHEAVAPGQPVLVLGAQRKGHIVKASLADRDLVQLARGDAVTVTLDALPELTLMGHITVLGGAASLDNGLFPIEVSLEKTAANLVPGMVARLTLSPASSKQTLLYVPMGAVVSGVKHNADVFVLEQDKARKRPVQVAFFTRDAVALTRGVSASDQVIVDGALYLSDGETVSVRKD